MTGTEIYKRTETYEREAGGIRLHAPQWKLLLAFDGQRSLVEVALSVDVAFAEALPQTEKFLERGWIAEQPITLDQYLKRTGATNVSAIGSAVPPVVVLHEAKSTATIPPPLSETALTEEPAKATPEPEVKLVAPPTPTPRRGPMRLSAVVDAIMAQAENSAIGQLLAYRVFLRVPPALLQAEEISSVNLVNDTSLIKGEELQRAISNAVKDILKRPLLDNVFAPA